MKFTVATIATYAMLFTLAWVSQELPNWEKLVMTRNLTAEYAETLDMDDPVCVDLVNYGYKRRRADGVTYIGSATFIDRADRNRPAHRAVVTANYELTE